MPDLGLLLVAFHSTLLRSLFASVSLCIVQYMENKRLRTIQLENNPLRSSEEPLTTAVFAAILPLSLAKEVRKNPPSEPHQTLRRAAAQSTGDQISAVGQISSDQHSMKHSHLSFLTPSPSPKGMFFAFYTVAADRAEAGRCLQLIDTEGAPMRCVFKK